MRTTLWDIWGQILIYLKIMQMSYVHFGINFFAELCRHTCLLPSRRKLVIFVENWNTERYLSLVPLRKKYPKMQLFSTMPPITTSGSGFHFIFQFPVLELIENDINIDRCSWRLFQILVVKVEKFKNYANELRAFCKKNLYGSSYPLQPLPLTWNLGSFVKK